MLRTLSAHYMASWRRLVTDGANGPQIWKAAASVCTEYTDGDRWGSMRCYNAIHE